MNEKARVVVIIQPNSPKFLQVGLIEEEILNKSNEIIKIAIETIQAYQLNLRNIGDSWRFLAVQQFDRKNYIVFDVFNDTYDYSRAHETDQNNIRVIKVILGKTNVAAVAGRPMENYVNEEIRSLHGFFGWEKQPPFYVDYTNGKAPYYPNPRNLQRTHETGL